jgi:hypothetical protein
MTSEAQPRSAREGAVIAGAWLIAIGLAFLVRELWRLPWGQAWPLFVIAVGVASLISSVVGYRRLPVGAWSLLWPLAWIGVGALLLASTTGRLALSPVELVAAWWPVALIIVGCWYLVASIWPRRRTADTLTLPVAGADQAFVGITFGSGELRVGRGRPGLLIDGRFEGPAEYRATGVGRVEVRPDVAAAALAGGRPTTWQLGLTAEVPLDLRVDTGAGRALLDLTELRVRLLDIRTGASETRVRLPSAAGQTWVRTQTGVSSLVLEVPDGVAARIRTSMALGRTVVDTDRFPPTAEGYASPDLALSPHRIEIDVQGGVGAVTIR